MTETAITIEESIKLEIAKFDPFEARLNELKELYTGLTIAGVDDKEGYENVRIAIAELRGIRTGTTKDKKAIKSPFLKACTDIEEKSQWIITEVSKIEDPLQKNKDAIDAEKEKIKLQKQAAQQAIFTKRTIQLSNMGVIFDGVNFILEDASYEGVLVKEADEDVYIEFILPKFKTIFDRRELVRLAEEKAKQEAIEKERQDREQFTAAQEELKRQRAEVLRQQQEAENERAEIARKEQLRLVKENSLKAEAENKLWRGRLAKMSEAGWNGQFAFSRAGNEEVPVFTYEELITLSDADFEPRLLDHNKTVSEIRDAQAKQREEKRLQEIRVAEESAAKKERERIAEEQRLAEIKRKQDEERKAEELAKAGDKANWDAFIANLKLVPHGTFRSGQYRKIASIAKEKIDEILNLKA